MPLVDTIPDSVLPNLPYDRSDAAIDAALVSMHPASLLCLYLNWRNRLIPAQPRRVAWSNALRDNPVTAARSVPIAQLPRTITKATT